MSGLSHSTLAPGTGRWLAGRFDEAVTAAQRLLTLPDPKTRALTYASIGHHEFAAGNLADALDAFQSALLENPDDSARPPRL